MMLVIVLIVICFGCIALYSIARHNALKQWTAMQIAAVGGAAALAVAAAFVLFGEPPPSSSADASSSVAVSSVAVSSAASSSGAAASVSAASGAPRPPFGVMPLAQAKRLTLADKRADGGIDNFGTAQYDATLHQLRVDPAKPFTISGWAASVPDKSIGSGVLILIDGKLLETGSYGIDRLDVANYYKLSELRYSGFSAQIPALRPGRHTLCVALGEVDHSQYHLLALMPLTLVVGG
jgi:hypothetical protein